MAKFARKKSVIDKNFADDDCDTWGKQKRTVGDFENDIKNYLNKKQPEWETTIADMEKRAALKKLEKSVEDDRNKVEGDLLFAIYSKYKVQIEKIGVWGALILGAIFIILVSSCFGGSNVEEAPVRGSPTTTLAEQSIPNVVSSQTFSFAMIVGAILAFPLLILLYNRGGMYGA
jgi:hypothetical protein